MLLLDQLQLKGTCCVFLKGSVLAHKILKVGPKVLY